ncbi:MAG: site-2 protease family protein [Candidatus Coatesbacteria bacterium]
MRGLKILTVRGIPIVLHWTFLVFIGLIALAAGTGGLHSALTALLIWAVLFTCIAMHELAHSMVAQRFGIRVGSILLTPIGGIASMDRMPDVPRQEILMSLAGPGFNLVLATIVFWFIWWLPNVEFIVDPFNPFRLQDVMENPTLFTQFTVLLFKVNMALGLFNLLPAFPMDGGRVFRAALALSGRSYARATVLAMHVSTVLLVLLGLAGVLVENPLLVVIAVLLYFAGQAETQQVRTRSALEHLRAEHLLPQEPLAVEPETPLGELVPRLLEGVPRHYPVVSRGRVVGVLAHPDLVAGLAREGGTGLPVSDVMRPPVVVGAGDPLDAVARRLTERGAPVALILDGGRLVGLVSREMLEALARQLDQSGA